MKFFIYLLFYGVVVSVFSQTGITGYTRNELGEILPFSTVYIKGTTNGTTSNSEGNYFLKTSPGTYTIVAQYIGYKTFEKEVTFRDGHKIQLNIELQEQVLKLQEVVVTSSNEDPAYHIIRETIKKRKFYENEVQSFKMDTYLKGLFRLNEVPASFFGRKPPIDTGIIYLSESISRFSFERPNKISERMISSKVSGNEQGFSFNQASDFNINFYKKTIDLSMERNYVSPISPSAFLFYDFELLGVFEENDKLINKIKVIPKRPTDPVFEGVIYIVENDWNLYSIDFLVTKNRGLEFIDSLRINQIFAPARYGIWMPLSQKFSFSFGAFKFKGNGYYLGVYSNYEIEPNYDLYKKENLYEERFEKEEKFEKEEFSAEVLVVEEGSNNRDSVYWKNIRPIPLSAIEINDYQVKDSMMQLKESIPYKDSLDRTTNKITLGNVFLLRYVHSNRIKENYWSFPTIFNVFHFNTIEGIVTELQPAIWKKVNKRTKYEIRPSIRYGFSNKKLNFKLEGDYYTLDKKFTQFSAGGGHYVAEYKEKPVAISSFDNSFYTLFTGGNYLKIYQKSFGHIKFRQEIKNGIFLSTKLEYAQRDTLTNTTDFTWSSDNGENFTSNQPANMELEKTEFDKHQSLIFEVTFRFRFKQKYATRPDGKFIFPSEYPEVFLTYKKGIEALGSDVNFDFIQICVEDDIKLGLVGTSSYVLAAGGFLNDKDVTFVDFKHFAGSQVFTSLNRDFLKFELLPYYQYSTTKPFLQISYQHHFNEFIFNKIPLVKKLNLQAVASINYLRTETIGNYVEIGAGIEHIFKIIRIDYYWAFQNNRLFGSGFRMGVGF